MFVLGYLFLLIGSVFIFIGVLGFLRMPDIFSKIQAGTKACTLGFLSIVLGVFFMHPEWWGKLLLIGFFALLANPIGSHILSRSAYGNREEKAVTDKDSLP